MAAHSPTSLHHLQHSSSTTMVLSTLREALSSRSLLTVQQCTQYPHPNLVSKVEHQPMKFNQRKREAGNIHALMPWCSWPMLLSTCLPVWLHHACCQSRLVQDPEVLEKQGSHAKNKQVCLPQSLLIYTTPQLQGMIFFFFFLRI